jgi:predicted amidohydrolase
MTAERPAPYYALALQTAVSTINSCADRSEAQVVINQTLERLATEIAASKRFIGADTALVVLPEYFLTAYPLGDTITGWASKAALSIDGPEYEALGKISQDNAIYLSGNAYEVDPHFDGLYFQTSFIIAPNGNVCLRYRRLNSMFAPTPHDVWDKYLDIYGLEGVFPVAKTEIGTLACIASEEILYPEIARALAMRGAEVFLHSTGEIGSTRETPKSIARQARAIENMAYVISANAGGIAGHQLPESATDGRSVILDYRGLVLAESGWGKTMTANANIDIAALRHARQRPGMSNYLSRQRFEVFAETYATLGSQKANSLLDNGTVKTPDRAHFIGAQQDAIATLRKRGIYGSET